ncbi:MAG: DNA-directed RNA polymerase subunit D [Nanohaloarchaea archaeon]|nr:DNA-directed RNA polymerase subunit D [Candidatus Nanohaloarchaea archaeon]
MKVKMISRDTNSLKFEISETTPVFASAIRRVILQKIPILSITRADFIDNTSALYDEIIAHRFGMLPIVFDPKKYVLGAGCKCGGKGCSSCQVKFVLKKEGPCTAYAKDMVSTDPAVKVLDGDIIIVKLLEGQSIDVEATATIGFAEDHAKWQSAIVGYSYYPKLIVDKKRIKEAKDCVDACPLGLITSDLKIKEPYSCNLCGSCEFACPDGAVTIEGDSSRIIFNIESVSGLSPDVIVLAAKEILANNVGEFEEALKKELK